MSILAWDDEATMLGEVNDSDYGLCANIWTNDISTGMRMADAVEAGYVWINGHGGKRYKGTRSAASRIAAPGANIRLAN